MSELPERREHHFEVVNDEFRVALNATCDDWTWNGIVGDITQRLAKPIGVITLPNPLTAEEAESLRELFQRRWMA